MMIENVQQLFSSRILAAYGLLLVPTTSFAGQFDSISWTYTPQGDAAGIITNVGATTVGVVKLILGPGFWLVMAIGCIISLLGFGRGNKEMLFSGLGLFIFAAVVRSSITLIMKSTGAAGI